MAVEGLNQAVACNGTVFCRVENSTLTVQDTKISLGGTTDNTPLAIYNTFWVWVENTSLQSSGNTDRNANSVIAFTGHPAQPNLGLIEFRNVVGNGGGLIIDCRTHGLGNNCQNGAGNFIFEDTQIENVNAMPYLHITNSSGQAFGNLSLIRIVNGDAFDCTYAGPMVLIDAGSVQSVHDFQVVQSSSNCTGGPYPVVEAPSNILFGFENHTPASGRAPANSSTGLPLGDTVQETSFGYDMVVNDNIDQLVTHLQDFNYCPAAGCESGTVGAPLRLGLDGHAEATYGTAPAYGLLAGDKDAIGYDSSLTRTSQETMAFQYAEAISPTDVAVSPTTGGSLPRGTYFYALEAASAAHTGNYSGESSEVPCTVSGSYNACKITWTAPGGTNPGACYLFRGGSSRMWTRNTTPYFVISNCTSRTSFTDTGGSSSGSGGVQLYNNTLQPFFRFPSNSKNSAGGTVPYYDTTPMSGDCAKWGSFGQIQDANATCRDPNAPVFGLSTILFSATPTFDAKTGNSFVITLTGSVARSTFSNGIPGNLYTFEICQDATGSRTFTWPTNVHGATMIGSTAGTCTIQTFMYNGTIAMSIATGVTGLRP